MSVPELSVSPNGMMRGFGIDDPDTNFSLYGQILFDEIVEGGQCKVELTKKYNNDGKKLKYFYRGQVDPSDGKVIFGTYNEDDFDEEYEPGDKIGDFRLELEQIGLARKKD